MTAQQINTESAATAYQITVQHTGPNYNQTALMRAAGTDRPYFQSGLVTMSNQDVGEFNGVHAVTKQPILRVWFDYDSVPSVSEERGADTLVDYRDGSTINQVAGIQVLMTDDQIKEVSRQVNDEGQVNLHLKAQSGAPSFLYQGVVTQSDRPYLPVVQYAGRKRLTTTEARENLANGEAIQGKRSAANLDATNIGIMAKISGFFGS